MRRREFIALGGFAAVVGAVSAHAQQKGPPVIGFLSSLSPGPVARHLAAFRQTLSEAGYDEGKTVTVEYRFAEGDYRRLTELARDLVHRGVNVIVAAGGDPAALAAKEATSTIPIVFMVG